MIDYAKEIEKIKKDEIKRKIYEGIKDMNEGNIIDGEEFFAILRKKYGITNDK